MEQRDNKTIMCSVLFLDIVAYSKKPVSVQIAQKERLNAMLADAIRNVPVSDRVILDTGDGAAITFLGDVSDALKAALSCRDAMLAETGQTEFPLEVRMGINLGPVRLIKDINGQPNIVGDGINVAQRIMGFAQDGQILVSRSYHDAASRLSQGYDEMFYSVGMRTDKHVREHEIYAILPPGAPPPPQTVDVGEATGKLLRQIRSAPPQQRALLAGIGVAALALLIVVGIKLSHHAQEPEPEVQAPQPPATAAAPDATTAAAQAPASQQAAAPVSARKSAEAAPAKKHQAETAKESKPATATAPATTAAQPEPTKEPAAASRAATLNFAVAPWGEVYVDGKKQGVSPPLDSLRVSPGKHVIEIRNTTFQPFTISIDVMDGEQLKIKHKFGS